MGSASLESKDVAKMDVSTTREQSVDTQRGGGFCPTPPFSGVGRRDSLEALFFCLFSNLLRFRETFKITTEHEDEILPCQISVVRVTALARPCTVALPLY